MAQNKSRRKLPSRRRGKAIIVVIALALALAFLGARLFRVYRLQAVGPSSEASLKPVNSIYDEFPRNHIHGLGYDNRNRRLLVATHYGIFIWKDGRLFRMGESRDDYMGFSLHPSDPSIIYASGHPQGGGNLGVIKSEDGGMSFRRIFRGLSGETVDFHSMAISPSDPEILYGSFHGRLYRSKDGGENWEIVSAKGLPSEGFCFGAPCLAADPKDAPTVYAGTPDGLLVSRDFGDSWTSHHSSIGGVAGVGIHPSAPDLMFAFTGKLGMAFSKDGGKSWNPSNGNLSLSRREFIFAFAFDLESPDHVFAATPEHVYRSTNSGGNWERIL